MAYVAGSHGAPPSYQLHALKLTTLQDAMPPVTVSAQHQLTNGQSFAFDAKYQGQRPALLLVNGNIYAGFGSFCDLRGDKSRGWVLGWNEELQPLTNNMLVNQRAQSFDNFFLSSVWMSGFGIASDGNQLFFATGNSDCITWLVTCPAHNSSYDGITDIQESVVSTSLNLTVNAVFTPANYAQLDDDDDELGAGGVMLVSGIRRTLWSSPENFLVYAGKDGNLFLQNANAVGQYIGTSVFSTKVVDQNGNTQGCWCGPSFFTGADGISRIVISHGNTLQTWKIVFNGSTTPILVKEGFASIPESTQDGGFFTTVSSNGRAAHSQIIWAVGRPTDSSNVVTLYAFDATPVNGAHNLLYSAPAGVWISTGNANILPVVANGRVFVASNKQLTIFGSQ